MANKNPYRPGAGKQPPALTGRDELIRTVREEIDRISEQGFGDRPYAIWGLRGIGKTAVLNYLVETVDMMDWFSVLIEARPDEGLAVQITQEMATILRRYRTADESAKRILRKALGVLKSFQVKFDPTGALALSADIEPQSGYADSGNQELDLQDVLESIGEVAQILDIGVLIAVDEFQDASESDLMIINRTLHKLGQKAEPAPILFIGAGLPTLPSVLSKATSYAERLYRYFKIERLDDSAIRLALTLPATELNVKWEDEAVDLIVEASQGYPYFVQQCGSSTWNNRANDTFITAADAKIGVAIAQEEIDRGLYRARWDRATVAGHEFMSAMARFGDEVRVADIVKALGKESYSDVSVLREKLINDGQIYSPARGKLAFTIPGMGDYILRTYADD